MKLFLVGTLAFGFISSVGFAGENRFVYCSTNPDDPNVVGCAHQVTVADGTSCTDKEFTGGAVKYCTSRPGEGLEGWTCSDENDLGWPACE